MARRTRVQYWSPRGRQAAASFDRIPAEEADIQQQLNQDDDRLRAICQEKIDDKEISEEVLKIAARIKSNANFVGFLRGYWTGSEIGQQQLKDEVEAVTPDTMIIGLIKEHPRASPTELCEIIEDYNIRAKDAGERTIHFPWSDLPHARGEHPWTENANVQKVKQRICELIRQAWRSLYASAFRDGPRFVDPEEVKQRSISSRPKATKSRNPRRQSSS